MTFGPVSLFDNIRSNIASDCQNVDFDDFVQIMEAYSQDVFASKTDAPLICLTEFKEGKRRKANAAHSSMVVLDIDDHIDIEDVASTIEAEALAALLCSTASHRPDKHKFRVFVPLADVAAYDDHRLAWHVANLAIADGKADPSKVGAESMFFVPGAYPDAPNVFQRFDGSTLTAEEWIQLLGSKSDVERYAGLKPRYHAPKTKGGSRKTVHTCAVDADLDLARSRLVSDKAIDDYRVPSGSYHHARFKLLLSIAGRASRLGVDLTQADLVHLFNQIDQQDGGFYQTSDYQSAIWAEAQKALTQV